MTAIDTTNLRLTFTVPANGAVMVQMRCVVKGAATSPQLLLGVLDGSTVKGRQAPIGGKPGLAQASGLLGLEACFVVTGLTPSASLTWDAAYGVETLVAATGIHFGGPNDTTGANASGGFSFEIWEADNLLAGTLYDPATAVLKATTALLAMTAFDATNLRLTFSAPASGRVLVKIRCMDSGGTSSPAYLLGVIDTVGPTVRARGAPLIGATDLTQPATTTHIVRELFVPVTGLTPNQSYTWDAAYDVETVLASTNIKYGGPNDASTADNAYGGLAYEIWKG